VVLGRSKYVMSLIKPKIEEFLKERGLNLLLHTGKVFRLKDNEAQLDFLGYTFKYNKK